MHGHALKSNKKKKAKEILSSLDNATPHGQNASMNEM